VIDAEGILRAAGVSPVTDAEGITRTAERFSRAAVRRSTYHYVVSKLRRDPATRAVAGLGPLGDVLDLGCGRGHLALYLLERGAAKSVRAFDWDEDKIALARRAGEGLDASFAALDVRHAEPEPADTVLLIDVLHYLDPAAQDALLDRAADLVRPGGRLVVRDATAGGGWRSAFTLFVEWISMLVRFNVGERVALRHVEREVVPVLEKKGLACTVSPCWEGTPFANVLLVASRPITKPRSAPS
jgi:2-polyprenyl-3-methyl-5-hydroxy-6-metoxy-1,4-benzoquinol methylase